MKRSIKSWEDDCVTTRRSKNFRKRRLKLFGIKKSDRVLDLGCGDGLNTQILTEIGVRDVVGLDISKNLLSKASKNNPKIIFIRASAEKMPVFRRKFNVVLVDSVLHHLKRYDKALMEINKVLLPSGYLCFIEPRRLTLRKLYDFICSLPISGYIPFLRERSRSYLGEKDIMEHWLRTEEVFFKDLNKFFIKCFLKLDLLSYIGKFRKRKL
ncbi:MAG: class I SAM-dependent methyltransferase [Candidatus Woesebacteria bacterium]|nr:class I SAM-dependent methyltransferase [Candidatus Woesebacteria bacterium]